jgi:DNA-binding response OmpR family regulator
MRSSILIVDDDDTLRVLLTFILEKDGHSVSGAESGAAMHAQMKAKSFDLILLDLGLPDENGIVLLRKTRAMSGPPVIILTGSRDQESVLAALELGAEDYINKPFNPREVLLRVKTVLRRGARSGASPAGTTVPLTIRFDGWTMDVGARCLRNAGNGLVPLTPGEFDLLRALVSRPGWVLSRDQLLDAVTKKEDSPSQRMIDVFISQLRAKIETDRKKPKLIQSVRGYGYMFSGNVE